MSSIEETILKKLDRIERLLDNGHKKKATWISVGFVKQLTLWNKEDMRRARDNGLIKWKHENGSFKYLWNR